MAVTQMGRFIMIAGALLVVTGALVWAMGRLGFRGLPGDIHYSSDRFSFYFPLGTCLLLSILLTGVLWLWQWLGRR